MTVKELCEAVAHLGFESEISDTRTLLSAANRALGLIFIDRPVPGRIRLDVISPKPVYTKWEIQHEGGESESFPLSGRAYTFRLSGRGSYTVWDGESPTKKDFFGDSIIVRGRLKIGGRVDFEGEFPYTVRALACYLAHFDSDSEVPELSETREIDLTSLVTDYMSPYTPPTDLRGNPITSATIINGVLSLPMSFSGEVNLTYRKRAPRLDGDGDSEIPLPSDVEPLLPIATAAFLWLDDEPDRAEYYMSLYREESAILRRYAARAIDTAYKHNGWA